MSSRSTYPLPSKNGPAAPSNQEDICRRSLRECTTRRFTQLYPGDMSPRPTLSSHVQWSTGRPQLDTPIIDVLEDDEEENIDDSVNSPILSEMDELLLSDDDHPKEKARTPKRTHLKERRLSNASSDATSERRQHDLSDSEMRQPSFPGNRDIMDSTDSHSSTSPSPETQLSPELTTPSPVSEAPREWAPSYHAQKGSTGLGLRLFPGNKGLPVDDKIERIGSWRANSASETRNHHYSSHKPHERVGNYTYSPSISASSAPPSPPRVLPPIQHLGLPHPGSEDSFWRYRDSKSRPGLKRPYTSTPPTYYGDSLPSSSSPQVLPPLLPHILGRPFPPQEQLSPASSFPKAPTGAPRNKNAWKDHAQMVNLPDGQTEWQCVWRVGHTGDVTDFCGYTAKRHLVKRHIETRHLQFKDHICSHCGKAFPQRVSLMIHVNRHTGAKPHECRYPDCDKTFSDPARRHKHMVEAHAYNPQGPRKRHRTTDSYHAVNSHFETLTPWPTKSGEGGARPSTTPT